LFPNKETDIDEASDTYDTIDWLVKKHAVTGMLGGISYPGFARHIL
jgi:predicted acyl esterase